MISGGVQNGIFRTLKCTFGVSGFRGSVEGPGDCQLEPKAETEPREPFLRTRNQTRDAPKPIPDKASHPNFPHFQSIEYAEYADQPRHG